jgi:uncharacterized OB-fold protein
MTFENEPGFIYSFEEFGELIVYTRCPECGRYIKKGECFANMLGEIRLTGWMCKKHGEVQPGWEWSG